MNMLSVESLSRTVGDRVLFHDLSLGLEAGEKVGLIGMNGSGKSTLLRVLAGQEKADTGQVTVRRGVRRAYLPQSPQADPNHTVLEHIFAGSGPRVELLRRYEEACARQAEGASNQAELDALSAEMDAGDAWGFEHSIRAMLHRFGVTNLKARMGELSGGMIKKTTLSQVIIDEADILLLDEPTNHLDIESVAWLERELRGGSFALVVVTHDRYFLENVVDRIYEIESGEVRRFPGNYSAYLERKAVLEEERERESRKASSLLKKELEWLQRQPKARGTKSKSRVERVSEIEKRIHVMDTGSFEFSAQGRPLGKKILSVMGVGAGFGERTLFSDFTHHFRRGERIGVVGPNGSGKTTLLEVLAGRGEPTVGKVSWGVNTQVGYFTQTDTELPADRRVLQYVREEVGHTAAFGADNVRIEASLLLEMFRLNPALPIGRLSGGERRRLQLVAVLAGRPNFLILDEPSNDLDTLTLSLLEDFLLGFDGCLVTASHDRWFMDRLTDLLFIIEDGHIRKFPGTFSEYLEFREARAKEPPSEERSAVARSGVGRSAGARHARSPLSAGGTAGAPEGSEEESNTARAPGSNRVRKRTYKEKHEFAQLEEDIPRLEARQRELEALLEQPESDYRKVESWGNELVAVQERLRESTERWLVLSDLVE